MSGLSLYSSREISGLLLHHQRKTQSNSFDKKNFIQLWHKSYHCNHFSRPRLDCLLNDTRCSTIKLSFNNLVQRRTPRTRNNKKMLFPFFKYMYLYISLAFFLPFNFYFGGKVEFVVFTLLSQKKKWIGSSQRVTSMDGLKEKDTKKGIHRRSHSSPPFFLSHSFVSLSLSSNALSKDHFNKK